MRNPRILNFEELDRGGRSWPRCNVELRARAEGDTRPAEILGSIPFDSRSEEIFGFFEIVKPGAFRESIALGDEVVAAANHNPDRLLGRRSVGTVTVRETAVALEWTIDTPDTAVGRDTVEEIRRGDLNGSSFAFDVKDEAWRTEDGVNVRELLRVTLRDVGPVVFPAYTGSTAQLRSLFAGAGSVLAPLAGVLVRSERKLPPLDGDRAVLEQAVEHLRAVLAGQVATGQPSAVVELLRCKLELAAIAV